MNQPPNPDPSERQYQTDEEKLAAYTRKVKQENRKMCLYLLAIVVLSLLGVVIYFLK